MSVHRKERTTMTIPFELRRIVRPAALVLAVSASLGSLAAQPGRPDREPAPLREARQLDLQGATGRAREILQRMIDSVTDQAVKAAAQRTMAMSYAFDGDCANTVKYEAMVIAYWQTREQAEPQNAFYQEGEMANEGARVCIDAGDLDTAEQWYRKGYELGMKEPEPRTHPASLWEFRLAHALGRIAARRGDTTEAKRQIANARRALDSDSAMAAQQERFFPYLVGYVALYTNDLKTAEAELTKAIGMRGNDRDPFMHCLLAMTYERMGRVDEAKALYQKAYDMATAHNPPAAFVRRFVREKLKLSASG
jgi:tetratricopeptide (TPR) repeat protein